jgi:ABC-type protease/lipase transport system fused ATPase/permease subunit
MTALSILTSRALAPVELAIAKWKGFVSARQGWARLKAQLDAAPETAPLRLPAPQAVLSVDNADYKIARVEMAHPMRWRRQCLEE